MQKLRVKLAGSGIMTSDDLMSRRNTKLKEMIEAAGKFELADVIDALQGLPEEQTQVPVVAPRKMVEIVIIWSGTQLSDFYIGKLRDEYLKLDDQTRHGDTGQLASLLYQRVVIEADRSGNETRKAALGNASQIQQALDQELIHFDAVTRTEKILSGFGQVLVHRPPDSSFIRLDMQAFPASWRVYNSGSGPLLSPALDASKLAVLVSIGHGYPEGHTAFPSLGWIPQDKLVERVGLTDTKNVLRIPLQCFPTQAVMSWPGRAISIENDGPSDDNEMKSWIDKKLAAEVQEWLSEK
ncbi:MAG: hypothetical protein JO345_08435 [Streptosporangiaceae bacterium]|nr:hypothetical protein [Streptosporangiaceae bacterium]